MHKYNPGDRVVVREDLECCKYYRMNDSSDTLIVQFEMVELAGKTVTIKSVSVGGAYYRLEESRWCWTDDMFSGLECDVSPQDIGEITQDAFQSLFVL